jgi:hypothetical protein
MAPRSEGHINSRPGMSADIVLSRMEGLQKKNSKTKSQSETYRNICKVSGPEKRVQKHGHPAVYTQASSSICNPPQ